MLALAIYIYYADKEEEEMLSERNACDFFLIYKDLFIVIWNFLKIIIAVVSFKYKVPPIDKNIHRRQLK